MNLQQLNPFQPLGGFVTFAPMGDKKRQWLKFTDETKRKLTMMSVHAGAPSVEEYGGDLFAELVEQMWAGFDPKAAMTPIPKPKSRATPRGR